jgi:antitoxin ParD1/3/4
MEETPPTRLKASRLRLNVSLPEELSRFIDEKVATGEYGTAGDYIRTLIRQAQERERDDARLKALLLEGLDSGPGIEVTPEFWKELRAEAMERYGNPRKP